MRSLLIFLSCLPLVHAQPLRLERTIPLPGVRGRIDHLSMDLRHGRLFVAALGNDTVEVLDLKQATRVHTITGLHEPQGTLYVPGADRLYVANAKDGTVQIYDGSSYRLLKSIALGEDADNLRYDPARQRVYAGYGNGALGVIDPGGSKAGDIRLDAHPESFQLEKNGPRIFVNLPDSRKIAVIDRASAKVIATWGTDAASSNFPMALDEAHHRLFVVCRMPARLLILDTSTGKVVAKLPVAGDCDDVFYDTARRRIYATGGQGVISVFQQNDPDHYASIATVPTVPGARTSFFSSELGKLFVAARQQGSQDAAIRVYAVQD